MDLRPASKENLADLIRLHQESFRGFLMAELGSGFLRVYYDSVIAYPRSLLYVAEKDGEVVGFVAGFLKPAGFYRELSKRRLRLAISTVEGLLRSPKLLFRVIGDMRRVEENCSHHDDGETAELASIAVSPRAARKGIGKQLVNMFCKAAFVQGAERVILTTDAENNVEVNEFYRRIGFKKTRSFMAPGKRLMNEYMITSEVSTLQQNTAFSAEYGT